METFPAGSPGTVPPGAGTDWTVLPCDSGACPKVKLNPDGSVSIGSTRHDEIVTLDPEEWVSFVLYARG